MSIVKLETPMKRALKYRRASDISPRLKTDDFVKNLLVSGSMAAIYGQSNTGKTFLATDLSLHIATGMTWHKQRVKQGAVIYLALEGSFGIENRVAAWLQHHDMQGKDIPFFVVSMGLDLRNSNGDADAVIATAKVIEEEENLPVRLIVIDTVSRALAGGSDCDPKDMGELILNGDKIRQETGACVLFIHHAGKDTDRGMRGWSGFLCAIDTEIIVMSEDGNRHAEVRKQRDLLSGQKFPFRLDVIELGENEDGEPVTSCVAVSTDKESTMPKHASSSLKGDALRAYEVLSDALAGNGQSGFSSVPSGFLSVSENLWRDHFYECAKPGAEQEAKKKAFQRATKELMDRKIVAMRGGRVWICYPKTTE